jgi:hypothetical protein
MAIPCVRRQSSAYARSRYVDRAAQHRCAPGASNVSYNSHQDPFARLAIGALYIERHRSGRCRNDARPRRLPRR